MDGEEAGVASFTDPAVGIKVDNIPVTVKGQPSFTVSAGGVALDDKVPCQEKAYTYTPWGGAPYQVDVYTVEVPYSTETVDLAFSSNVLAYNYTADGGYISGYYEDYHTGDNKATVPVNANAEPIGTDPTDPYYIPADNDPD